MGGGDHIRTGGVQLGMDGEGGAVEPGRGAGRRLHDLALVADQHQVGDTDAAEMDAQRVDPELVRVLGVARGDVAGAPHVEALSAEQPIAGGQPLLAIEPLRLERGLDRDAPLAEGRQDGLDLVRMGGGAYSKRRT